MATIRCRLALTVAVLLAGLVPAAVAGTVTCDPSPLEIVFAVDVSSSLMPPDFANLKLFLQEMAGRLPIAPTLTRPAVISFSTDVKVEVHLDQTRDLQSFKDAVNAIPYYRGFTATGPAMQLARRAVFPKSRPGASKLLVVVTDGLANMPGSRAEAIALVRSESAALRGEGVRIHAVGIVNSAGVVLRDELEAIAGSDDFSMINDFKSLNALVDALLKEICKVKCHIGTESFPGQCFSGTQRVVHVTQEHNKALSRCEKSITHEYRYCGQSHLCKEADVTVGDCVNGAREIATSWEDFDVQQQKCVIRRSVQKMDCSSVEVCKGSVAEILFLLDGSGSINNQNWRLQLSFLSSMAGGMKIGADAIRLGVIVFGTAVSNDIPLGSIADKAALLKRIGTVGRRLDQQTNTGDAIKLARAELARRARPGVPRVAVLMTDGESNTGPNAVQEAAKLESDGVSIIVIGVGSKLKKEELEAIATPPLSHHLFYATDFDKLVNWAGKISEETCHVITPPDPSLCELPPKRVVSSCYNSLQKVTEIKYEFDAQGRCNKKMLSDTTSPCKVVCTDPINGNEYFDGETWKSECATFVCRRPDSQTAVFKPTATECPGADEQCFSADVSEKFKCRDDKGKLFGHCNCLARNGDPVLRIVTADANTKP